MQRFTIASIQMQVSRDKEANLARAGRLLEQAAQAGAKLAVLPEMFTCPYELDQFRPYAESLPDGPASRFLRDAARRLGIHIAGASIPELDGDDVYNTATLWAPDGELLLTHRKVHLFDVDIPGGISFHESESLAAGDRLATAETDLGTLGLAICYDLRFPECFRALVVDGAELIILPGAFNTTTGPAHWEPLLRARAIENTCYVVACSPAPHPDVSYPAWGHSMIIDPYGEVKASAEREEQIVLAEVDGERLEQVRQAVPVLAQRRPDVYRGDPK